MASYKLIRKTKYFALTEIKSTTHIDYNIRIVGYGLYAITQEKLKTIQDHFLNKSCTNTDKSWHFKTISDAEAMLNWAVLSWE